MFDDKNGGNGGSGEAGKAQAMQFAAAAAMRLCSKYPSTGKFNFQPGEIPILPSLSSENGAQFVYELFIGETLVFVMKFKGQPVVS